MEQLDAATLFARESACLRPCEFAMKFQGSDILVRYSNRQAGEVAFASGALLVMHFAAGS